LLMYIAATPAAITGIATPSIVLWWISNRFDLVADVFAGGCRGKIPKRRRRIERDTRGGWPTNHPAPRPLRKVIHHVKGTKSTVPDYVLAPA